MTVLKVPDGQGGLTALPLLRMVDGLRPDGSPRKVACGQRLVTAVQAHGSIVIPHQLGATPVVYAGFPAGWPGYVYGQTADGVNIALSPSVALSSQYVTWFAIG